jgi:DNA-binding NarL/FixJ family response regulator
MLAQSLDLTKVPPEYILFILGVGILIWTVGRMRKQAVARKNPPPQAVQAPPPGAPSHSDLHAMANELHQLINELHETSRRIAAQIDNRVTKLDILLQEADAKIARMENLTASRTNASDVTSTTSSPAPTGNSAVPVREHFAAPATGGPAPVPTSHPTDPRQKSIYALADQGRSPREIAQELGTSPGEVELILNLRRRT